MLKVVCARQSCTLPYRKLTTINRKDRKSPIKVKETPKEAPTDIDSREDLTRLLGEHERLKEAYGELRRELKLTDRENREQSLELRDLKRENTTLKEAYNNIRKESPSEYPKFSKSERNKYLEHFERLEEQAAYYEQEFRKREGHLIYLTKQTRDANQERECVEEDNRKLQRKVRELSANLTECRDDILRLQPSSQTSDSEIAEQYSDLCQQVAGWVDDKTEDPTILEGYFGKLGSVDNLPQGLRAHVSNRQLKFGKSFPECLPLLVQYLIHCRIQENLFGPEVFLFGLHESHVALLQGIEEGMSELEPKRGEG
ncbi:MAG: hypothetical protein Q9163_003312 [Psora crenata]